jgi:hypothetical protein
LAKALIFVVYVFEKSLKLGVNKSIDEIKENDTYSKEFMKFLMGAALMVKSGNGKYKYSVK